MPRQTTGRLRDRRALNQLIIRAADFPATPEPAVLVRTLRAALRMSQAQLAERSGINKRNIARIERGASDIRVGTLMRLFEAMFCDLVIFPRPWRRPGDAVADQYIKKPIPKRLWG